MIKNSFNMNFDSLSTVFAINFRRVFHDSEQVDKKVAQKAEQSPN